MLNNRMNYIIDLFENDMMRRQFLRIEKYPLLERIDISLQRKFPDNISADNESRLIEKPIKKEAVSTLNDFIVRNTIFLGRYFDKEVGDLPAFGFDEDNELRWYRLGAKSSLNNTEVVDLIPCDCDKSYIAPYTAEDVMHVIADIELYTRSVLNLYKLIICATRYRSLVRIYKGRK